MHEKLIISTLFKKKYSKIYSEIFSFRLIWDYVVFLIFLLQNKGIEFETPCIQAGVESADSPPNSTGIFLKLDLFLMKEKYT